MKKIIGVVACLCLLAGCAGGPLGEAAEQEILDALAPHYETDIVLQIGDDTLRAHIAHRTPEQCEVTLSAPENLAGMRYLFRQNNVDVSFRELSFTLDPDGMPSTAPAKLAVDALALLLRADDPTQLQKTDGGWELRAELFGVGECVLELDGADYTPRKLFLSALEWEIGLENFVIFI